MARAGTGAVILAFVVCFLLVAPAPARRPVDLPPQLPDAVEFDEAAAEKLPPTKTMQVADQATAIAVPEEEGTAAIAVQEERPEQRSSLLCLVFRCGGSATQERQALDGWAQQVVAGTTAEEEEQGAYDSDSDWDSDSDDDDEGGIVGWFWRLADGF